MAAVTLLAVIIWLRCFAWAGLAVSDVHQSVGTRSERRTIMPGKKAPGPSVKDPKVYEEVRGEGGSKEKAARIANASAARGRSSVGEKGGKSGSYEDSKVDDLRKRAKELGLSGNSGKKKSELVSMLRNH
jgi:hypothetical protein